MNVIVKFLLVSAHFGPKKRPRWNTWGFFLQIRPLVTGFSWKTAKLKPDHETTVFSAPFQGHPMDLFLIISVLQAIFCWLGDLEKIICLGRKVKVLLGNRQFRVSEGIWFFGVANSWYVLFVRNA